MTDRDIGGTIARLLLDQGAIVLKRDQPFILAAGWASPVYVDCRRLIGDPSTRRIVTESAVAAIGALPNGSIEVIAGAETAGIPFAVLVAEALGLPFAFVRKRPLGIGRNAQVEGASVEDRRVLLIDDLTTDGASKIAFARGLRTAGAHVHDALTIFYNGLFPGVEERLHAERLSLTSLCDWGDVIRVDDGLRLTQDDRAMLDHFRKDPIGWSVTHGGRGAPTKLRAR